MKVLLRKTYLVMAGILGIGFFLRLCGITWGLPDLFNADEPHFVNLAVSFGSGDLNPHLFKYPTLWMYLLFALYGVYYAAWSCFGLWYSVEQFGALFVWEPASFYLIGRLAAVLLSCAALVVVSRLDQRLQDRGEGGAPGFPWALGIMAVSPVLVYSAHECKPDSLLLFLSALAWHFGLRVYGGGRLRDYVLGGLCAGLAVSSQYTAVPVLGIIPLAHLLCHGRDAFKRGRAGLLAGGILCSVAGGFAGAPFVLLDFATFRQGLMDHRSLMEIGSYSFRQTVFGVWTNPFRFGHSYSLLSAGLALGLWRVWKRDKGLLMFLLFPYILYGFFMCFQTEGSNVRYFFACFPAWALLASQGMEWFSELAGRRWRPLVALCALLPGLWFSVRKDRSLVLPDTRPMARRWIEANLPVGAGILVDQLHASPQLKMSRSQVEELYVRTASMGSRRERYYQLMLGSHPGGGYRVHRVQRSALDLWSPPKLVEKTQKEGPYLDVREGLSVLRKNKVRYVVTSSDGANPDTSVDLKLFFEQLSRQGKLLAAFTPDQKTLAGPELRVYEIP